MSVAEIAPRNDDFERTPPHDVAAEQCVLGGMLLSKDAISDVIEVIRPTDHYRPAHQLVHEAILDLYGRGEPADAITVANELTRRGEIARVGGGPYLHTLIASVPTAANAGYYARIVRERAVLRRLVEAGTRIVQFGYAGEADADDLVDRAQAEVFAVTDRRSSEDYHSLSEIMPGALDEIEAMRWMGGDDLKKQVFITVQNLFDTKPPIVSDCCNPGLQYPTDRVKYDVIGAYFTVGLRVTY